MTVAVDFDGVIHAYSKGWQGGAVYDPPLAGAIESMTRILDREAVFILTARDVHQVERSLRGWGLPAQADLMTGKRRFWNRKGVLLVTNFKYPARAYLDDRGVRFENWDQAMDALGYGEGGAYSQPLEK